MIEEAKALVARAARIGMHGRTLSAEECLRLTTAIPDYPVWLIELLSTVPLCGLELGWQADDPEPDFDGVSWLEVSDAELILSESQQLFPGYAILEAGYVNFGGDGNGCGDPYFIPINEGADPPLYQVGHDYGHDAETVLADGRRMVAPRLSEFLSTAILERWD